MYTFAHPASMAYDHIFHVCFFNHTATAQIYTLSLHDALPILWPSTYISPLSNSTPCIRKDRISSYAGRRSEERFSRNAETDLVCRLLLEKKKNANNALTQLHPQVNVDDDQSRGKVVKRDKQVM